MRGTCGRTRLIFLPFGRKRSRWRPIMLVTGMQISANSIVHFGPGPSSSGNMTQSAAFNLLDKQQQKQQRHLLKQGKSSESPRRSADFDEGAPCPRLPGRHESGPCAVASHASATSCADTPLSRKTSKEHAELVQAD